MQVLELRKKITSSAETELGKQQREYVLRQQMRAIQDELGEKSPEKAEVDERAPPVWTRADLPEAVRKEADRELSPPGASAVGRSGFPGGFRTYLRTHPRTAVEHGA